jgi:molybdate transport system substrate-binding protein
MRRLCTIFVLMLGLFALPFAAIAADATVYAAASLKDALSEIGDLYKAKSGKTVEFSFAASSALGRQIEAGTTADMFFSADTDWMDYVQQRSLIEVASRKHLLSNRLVLIAPADSQVSLTIEKGFDIKGALGDGRLSLADPDSVPAGKYARAALTSLGVWSGVADKLVRAENVRVALTYVARGEAPLGIVYETDAKSEAAVKVIGVFPSDSHPPIIYPVALTPNASETAREFLTFVEGPKGAEVFRKYGFIVLEN